MKDKDTGRNDSPCHETEIDGAWSVNDVSWEEADKCNVKRQHHNIMTDKDDLAAPGAAAAAQQGNRHNALRMITCRGIRSCTFDFTGSAFWI